MRAAGLEESTEQTPASANFLSLSHPILTSTILSYPIRKDRRKDFLTAKRRPGISPGDRTSEEAEKISSSRVSF